ncbi:MAG: hypothetical protein AAGA85_04750 [Bacteroidota bacterium]
MKRYVPFFIGLFISFYVAAQEGNEGIIDQGISTVDNVTEDIKIVMLCVFAATCIFFTARTFRNKPEA